jgi:hypothetical protein
MTKKPKESLSNRAMVVNLSASLWRGLKKDKRATAQTYAHHSLDSKAKCSVTKQLIAAAVAPIKSAIGAAYQYHYRVTLPWGEHHDRVIKATKLFDYTTRMRQYEQEFDAAVSNLISQYAEYLEQEHEIWKDMFRIEDYPSVEVLKKKFRFTWSADPLPVSGDFRIDLGDELTTALRDRFEDQLQDRVKGAMADAWDGLYQQVEQVASILRTGNVKAIKAVTFDATRNLCTLLTDLNITDDPNLETMRAELETLLCSRPADGMAETLRQDDSDRVKKVKDLEAIMKKMTGYMGAASESK